jgi:hypothetical protein
VVTFFDSVVPKVVGSVSFVLAPDGGVVVFGLVTGALKSSSSGLVGGAGFVPSPERSRKYGLAPVPVSLSPAGGGPVEPPVAGAGFVGRSVAGS